MSTDGVYALVETICIRPIRAHCESEAPRVTRYNVATANEAASSVRSDINSPSMSRDIIEYDNRKPVDNERSCAWADPDGITGVWTHILAVEYTLYTL